jgi:ribosomal protein S18 acetylase RimI-like enzyme
LRDAAALAAVQRDAWLALLGRDVPTLAAALEIDALERTWADAIVLAQAEGPYAVLAGLDEAGQVAGFAALGPLLDPDRPVRAGELVALWVAPDRQRAGHGSRLLAAAAQAARAPGAAFERLSHWVARHDVYRQRFLRGAGFALDGAERTWQAPSGELIDEQRWSALLP